MSHIVDGVNDIHDIGLWCRVHGQMCRLTSGRGVQVANPKPPHNLWYVVDLFGVPSRYLDHLWNTCAIVPSATSYLLEVQGCRMF